MNLTRVVISVSVLMLLSGLVGIGRDLDHLKSSTSNLHPPGHRLPPPSLV